MGNNCIPFTSISLTHHYQSLISQGSFTQIVFVCFKRLFKGIDGSMQPFHSTKFNYKFHYN